MMTTHFTWGAQENCVEKKVISCQDLEKNMFEIVFLNVLKSTCRKVSVCTSSWTPETKSRTPHHCLYTYVSCFHLCSLFLFLLHLSSPPLSAFMSLFLSSLHLFALLSKMAARLRNTTDFTKKYAELGRQNPNVYCLYMFVHHFFLYFFTRLHERCFCDGDCNCRLKEALVFGHHSTFCHFITTSSCWTSVWGRRFGVSHS